jgi:hypothetical protein
MVYGQYVSIVRETHHSKEGGHKVFHNINIVSREEKIKVQGVVEYHDINIDHSPPQSNRKLRKDP